jgi:DUF438 domain-containing protein
MLSASEENMPGKMPGNLAVQILSALPLDITFIDEDDIIRYYSDYRIFNRTPEIIGTTVQNCHSPASRAAVDKVIDDLKTGREDVIEQPTKKGGRPVMVRYVAVRGQKGEYLGLLETCQWVNGKTGKQ